MKTTRPEEVAAPTGLVAAWNAFWFRAVDPVGLHRLRLLAGLVFLFWLLPFAGHVDEFFSMSGWFDARAFGEAAGVAKSYGEDAPVPLWSVLYGCPTPAATRAVYGASIAVLVLFTLGLWPRVTALLTYLIVASFTASPAIAYDADPLLLILSFYLMIGYLLTGQGRPGLSWRDRLLGPKEAFLFRRSPGPASESIGANLGLRLFQVHFALAMVASGLHKLQFGDWWYGVGYWFDLFRPFEATVAQVRALRPSASLYLNLLSLAAYATIAWQVAFPAFAWRVGRASRVTLFSGALVALVACPWMLELPLFGSLIALGCLGYLTPAEWHRLGGWLGRLPGLGRLANTEAPAPLKGPKATPSPAITGGSRR